MLRVVLSNVILILETYKLGFERDFNCLKMKWSNILKSIYKKLFKDEMDEYLKSIYKSFLENPKGKGFQLKNDTARRVEREEEEK